MLRLFTIFGVMLSIAAAHYAQFERMNGPKPSANRPEKLEVVTGSVPDNKAKQLEAVRAILAQASEVRPDPQQVAPPGSKQSRRGRIDQVEYRELQLGGTGLLDSDETAAPKAPHPLAVANPNDHVVICEAGCRPHSDRIVFRISKTAAAQAARRLELTSVQEVARANEVVCIAGCYDDEPGNSSLQTGSIDGAAPIEHAEAQKELEADLHTILAEATLQSSRDIHVGPRRDLVDAIVPTVKIPDTIIAEAPPEHAIAAHLISVETREHLVSKRVAGLRSALQRWREANVLRKTGSSPAEPVISLLAVR